jgi:hypothetical protein
VGPLGIRWARTSWLVSLGTTFTNFLTGVVRSGVPPAITRSESNDIVCRRGRLGDIDPLRSLARFVLNGGVVGLPDIPDVRASWRLAKIR